MNIHDRFREELEARAEALSQLEEGSEAHKRAADEYINMYKLALEHEKIDEEINDRRYKIDKDDEVERIKIDKDQEIERKKMWHGTFTKIASIAVVAGSFIGGIKLENEGYIKPKLSEVLRIIKF